MIKRREGRFYGRYCCITTSAQRTSADDEYHVFCGTKMHSARAKRTNIKEKRDMIYVVHFPFYYVSWLKTCLGNWMQTNIKIHLHPKYNILLPPRRPPRVRRPHQILTPLKQPPPLPRKPLANLPALYLPGLAPNEQAPCYTIIKAII